MKKLTQQQIEHNVYQVLSRRGFTADTIHRKLIRKIGFTIDLISVEIALQSLRNSGLAIRNGSRDGNSYLYRAKQSVSLRCK